MPRKGINTIKAAWLACTVICAGTAGPLLAENSSLQVDQIKAAYLFNLLKFTHWPEASTSNTADNPSPTDNSSLGVCIAGNNQVAELLAKGLRGRAVQGRPLEIIYIPEQLSDKALSQLQSCNFLYVGKISTQQTRALLQYTADLPVVTASDQNDFSDKYGIVELKTDPRRDKITIVINQARASEAGVSFSSKLLKLAILK